MNSAYLTIGISCDPLEIISSEVAIRDDVFEVLQKIVVQPVIHNVRQDFETIICLSHLRCISLDKRRERGSTSVGISAAALDCALSLLARL